VSAPGKGTGNGHRGRRPPNGRAKSGKREEARKYGLSPEHVDVRQYEPKPNGHARNKDAKLKQADILIGLSEEVELFHSPERTGFADVEINGNRETWRLRSREFKQWTARRFFEETESAPNSEALHSALNVIEARANFDAPERNVHIRVGGLDGQLYLDLGDRMWRVVEINTTGWRVIDRPPVRFRRAPGMKAMPVPVAGGSIDALRSFLNIQAENDFVLVVSWLCAALRNDGPYPILAVSGEQGSAKSTFSAVLRTLIDPNTAPAASAPPRGPRPVHRGI
jgi:hypothetical protein